jgi:formylmethanofuran dehydrogenase subunit A
LDSSKKTLNHLCTEIFQEDLKNGEIYGNHTIETSQGKLTVNFRMSPESDISAYENILRAEFKEDYVELFREIANIEVTTAYPNQKSQFSEHPEIFTLILKKNITMGEMKAVFKKYPDLFEIAIRDKERYADVYPNSVKIEKKVYPNHSFIDKLEKFSDVLRKRVINILSKFFDKNMECAVKA